jgi:Icc-related predicted phosphoesterase
MTRLKLARRTSKPRQATTDLYYASDVHGSDQCWRKFLGAGRFYEVDALVMGGDLAGKAVVPIEVRPDGSFRATFMGENRSGTTPDAREELVAAIRFNGMYAWTASATEIARHRDDAEIRGQLFQRIILDDLGRWLDLADERMSRYGISVFVMGGNDDPWACDEVIEAATYVQACDDRVVHVGPHEMISCSYANRTPWDSPRELDEEDLYKRIRALAEKLEDPSSAIFNLHVPPYDSGLDTAQKLTADFAPALEAGAPVEIPVGSQAVRRLIEEYQPLLALHGHIHESRGDVRIGRTLAINPGSEYNSGRIHGVKVSLSETAINSYQYLAG